MMSAAEKPGLHPAEHLTMTLPNGHAIEMKIGDITHERTDAIVNAANSRMVPGSGVCGAIFAVAGAAFHQECREAFERHGEVEPGSARATSAGGLGAKHVIHAVGPVWHGGEQGESSTLANAYRHSLKLADEELKSTVVSTPSLATGIFGFPVQKAAPVALREVADALLYTANLRTVRFVLFDAATFDVFEAAARGLAHERSYAIA
ncbi:MAG: macro domain-containing protein [Acidobacteriota bacterium]|nr:macro domain-containing protein [Acidobacteriota bacterium]